MTIAAILLGLLAIGLLASLLATAAKGEKKPCSRCHNIDDSEMQTMRAAAADWKSKQISGQIRKDEPPKHTGGYMGM